MEKICLEDFTSLNSFFGWYEKKLPTYRVEKY